MANIQTEDTTKATDDEMICTCAELRRSGIDRLVTEENLDFDMLLRRTGAGGTCTACLLDLEYAFVAATERRRAHPQGLKQQAWSSSSTAGISLKARLYRWLDQFAPLTAHTLVDHAPVLAGGGITTWITVANDYLLYDQQSPVPCFEVRLVVRDKNGRICHIENRKIEPGAALKFDASRHIAPETAALCCGSIEITRQALRPGYRGTTRPQIEVCGARGDCAVHAHGAGETSPRERWFTVLNRPQDERVFLTIINLDATPMVAEVYYPVAPDAAASSPQQIMLAPRGAVIHELVWDAAVLPEAASRTCDIRVRFSGLYNLQLLIAERDLGYFSIDHVSG